MSKKRKKALTPRLREAIEMIVSNDPDAPEYVRTISGEQMCVLMDLERKLYALRTVIVAGVVKRMNPEEEDLQP